MNYIMNILNKIKYKLCSIAYTPVNNIFDHYLRKKLHQKNFSIICSNCIGGIIYHRLGQNFYSPTINLWLWQTDFIKFIQNLRWYISQELCFVETKEYDYPVARLGDIFIHFNHSNNTKEAAEDWNRRKERINYDNLFIILYEKDGLNRDQLLQLKHIECKKIIVLTMSKENIDIPYVKYIRPDKKQKENYKYFLDKDELGIRTFEKQWNFVEWLNK